MKKALSILLAAVMAFSVLSFSSAAGESGTETFINEVISSSSFGVCIEEIDISPLYIHDFRQEYKIIKVGNGEYHLQMKISGVFSLFGLPFLTQRFEAIVSEGEAYAYIPGLRLKCNIAPFLGLTEDDLVLYENPFDISELKVLQCTSTEKVTLDNGRTVDVDKMTIDPYNFVKMQVENGEFYVDESVDLSTLTEEELYQIIAENYSITVEEAKAAAETNYYNFYVDDGKVFAVEFVSIDENGNAITEEYNLFGFSSSEVDYVYTGIEDDEFNQHPLYIDITGIAMIFALYFSAM